MMPRALGLWLLEQRTRLSPGSIYHTCALTQPTWTKPVLQTHIDLPCVSSRRSKWAPDGSRFVIFNNRYLCIRDASAHKVGSFTCSHHIQHAIWSPDGARLLVMIDKTILLFDQECTLGRTIQTDHQITQVMWTIDGAHIIVKTSSKAYVMTVTGHLVKDLAWLSSNHQHHWSPDQRKVVTVPHVTTGDGPTNSILYNSSGHILALIPTDHTYYNENIIVWAPNSNAFAVGVDKSVTLWSASGARMARITDPDHRLICPEWTPDGSRIVTLAAHNFAPDTNLFKIWDLTGTLVHQTKSMCSMVHYLMWSPNRSRFAMVMSGGTVQIRDFKCRLLSTFNVGKIRQICVIVWSPDGSVLEIAGNSDVKLWTGS